MFLIEKDLHAFWIFISNGSCSQEVKSSFVVLLSEIVVKFGGKYWDILFDYLSQPRDLNLEAVFLSLNKILVSDEKLGIPDQEWGRVFRTIREIFKSL